MFTIECQKLVVPFYSGREIIYLDFEEKGGRYEAKLPQFVAVSAMSDASFDDEESDVFAYCGVSQKFEVDGIQGEIDEDKMILIGVCGDVEQKIRCACEKLLFKEYNLGDI